MDLLVAFDGHPAAGIDDLQRLLTEERVGTVATLTVIRGTRKLHLPVRPVESP